MTKAEKQAERRRKAAAKRQRAFRDRRRGGPARGRWADHKSAFTPAAELGLDRLLLVLVEWLKTFAPDAARDLHRGWLKVGRDERTLQKEITAALDRAHKDLLLEKSGIWHPEAWGGLRLIVRRRGDRFAFKIVPG